MWFPELSHNFWFPLQYEEHVCLECDCWKQNTGREHLGLPWSYNKANIRLMVPLSPLLHHTLQELKKEPPRFQVSKSPGSQQGHWATGGSLILYVVQSEFTWFSSY